MWPDSCVCLFAKSLSLVLAHHLQAAAQGHVRAHAEGGGERQQVVREHAATLVAAGATLVEERHDEFSWWIVLTDPEGNEFCLQ